MFAISPRSVHVVFLEISSILADPRENARLHARFPGTRRHCIADSKHSTALLYLLRELQFKVNLTTISQKFFFLRVGEAFLSRYNLFFRAVILQFVRIAHHKTWLFSKTKDLDLNHRIT